MRMVNDAAAGVTVKAIYKTNYFFLVESTDQAPANIAGGDKLIERNNIAFVVTPSLDLQIFDRPNFRNAFDIAYNYRFSFNC